LSVPKSPPANARSMRVTKRRCSASSGAAAVIARMAGGQGSFDIVGPTISPCASRSIHSPPSSSHRHGPWRGSHPSATDPSLHAPPRVLPEPLLDPLKDLLLRPMRETEGRPQPGDVDHHLAGPVHDAPARANEGPARAQRQPAGV